MAHPTPGFDAMLADLVACPSVSSTSPEFDQGNLGVINTLANWLEALGFACEVQPLPDRPGKGNLIARLGAGDDGLVLAGHTDTVPFDADLWQQDPFQVKATDAAWFGLGTCDMKGFFPLVVETVSQFRARDLRAPVTVIATSDEESSMAGARLLAAKAETKARYAVIGEPTNLVPVYAHKGIMMIGIRLDGASGHSSDPSLGNNALDAMHAVMGELLAFRAELAANYTNPAFQVQVPTLNLGCLRAGDNPNRICGHAELQIDLRLLPGMDSDAFFEALTRRVNAVSECFGTRCCVTRFYPPVPPFAGADDGLLALTLAELSGAAPDVVAFGTEGPFLQQLGMETVIFGPGSIDQAHQPNEFLERAHVARGRKILSGLIERLCVRI
ncbi:MAG: acetylornithine deacetylase [Pseudomonadales bacterium]